MAIRINIVILLGKSRKTENSMKFNNKIQIHMREGKKGIWGVEVAGYIQCLWLFKKIILLLSKLYFISEKHLTSKYQLKAN